MNKILIVGAGGHARVVADIIRCAGQFEIEGFIDQLEERAGEPFEGSVILGGASLVTAAQRRGVKYAAVAIGDNDARLRVADELRRAGYELPAIVHPSAVVASSAELGEGTLVCAGAVVNPATRIGRVVILNTSASVDHDCAIADGVHIAPGSHLGGNVSVGYATLIGLGASVKPGITIGKNVTVGVGAAVVSDVSDQQTVVGVPARVVR